MQKPAMDVVSGLVHLHELGMVHRDLKPENVLILKEGSLCAKLSDMGISKRLVGSSDGVARAMEDETSVGDHFERDNNIVKSKADLFLVEDIPEAVDLSSRLLDTDAELRPKASEVLNHPLFWDSDIQDYGFSMIKMESAFLKHIGKYRRYKYDSVRDLVRVVRNQLNHYLELPLEIQKILGPANEGFDGYFRCRYPRLLMEVYKVMHRYCREEEGFNKYFKGSEV
ncbi:hypothetical protein RHSIM_Rhsim10G0194100 [Rhododendron simsii]|uniref:Uncharacterized protein n=1 Tax=Rhododendron simsii TaxID=118357 RepID=A0A834GHX8_RHOSS|nr:hypothetical protein RHSIM_Rhsim10G0194100 [Rhododendron simsii]